MQGAPSHQTPSTPTRRVPTRGGSLAPEPTPESIPDQGVSPEVLAALSNPNENITGGLDLR